MKYELAILCTAPGSYEPDDIMMRHYGDKGFRISHVYLAEGSLFVVFERVVPNSETT